MRKEINRGFSLIELMTVVGIIALMSALAIPIYQDYAIRTRVAEGMAVAAAAKSVVVLNAAMAASDFSSGYVPPNTSDNVSGIVINSQNGEIDIQYTVKAGAITGASNIVMSPKSGGISLLANFPPIGGAIQWTCTSGTLPSKYRPTQCRT
jgi:type IV pilus assembly protein PilA